MAVTYTPTTNFGAKDTLPTNDPSKVVKGSEFSVEFTAIQTAFGQAAPNASPTFTGTVTIPTADINGGAIDGTAIGANSASTGAFTTLTASGDVNFDGGTFFVDASANAVGIGTTSPFTPLQVDGASGNLVGVFETTTGNTNRLYLGAESGASFVDATAGVGSTSLVFKVASTERARIDSSGNLDLGTTASADRYQNIIATSAKLSFNAGTGFTGSAATSIYNQSAIPLVFGTNNSERARLDASGNLLVGTTSGAPGTPKISVSGSVQTLWGNYRVGTVFDNSFRQGMYFDSTNRNMYLFSTTSDTGGNIVFSTRNAAGSSDSDYGTERMRIDASGNVGIGTSSPADLLHVKSSTAAVGDYQIVTEGTVGGYGAGVSFQSQLTGGSLAEMARITADGEAAWDTTAANQDAGLRFYTSLDGTVVERARLDASGSLLVGTTSAAGSPSLTARVTGGIFSTANGTTSVPNATWTTLATIPTGDGVYLVTAILPSSGDPANYNAVSIVTTSISATNLVDVKNAPIVDLRMSGSSLQVNQAQGTTQNINWSILRLA